MGLFEGLGPKFLEAGKRKAERGDGYLPTAAMMNLDDPQNQKILRGLRAENFASLASVKFSGGGLV